MKKTVSITTFSFASSFFTAALLLMTSGYLWYQSEQKSMEESFEAYKTDYLATQRSIVQLEVDGVLQFIQYSESQTESRMQDELQSRVYEAYTVAEHIYDIHKNTQSSPEIIALFKEALRPLRFGKGLGYYFVVRMDGVVLLHADRPDLEGVNISNTSDTSVFKGMHDLVKDHGEGFYTYKWTKPNHTGSSYPKTAFLKYFEPFDCFIGTGAYLDTMSAQIRQEVLGRIDTIRFGEDHLGYVFVMKEDGTLISHINPDFVGKKILNIKDLNGVSVQETILDMALDNGKGFVTYHWEKPGSGIVANKLSYVRQFKDWGWVLGAGVYIDDLDRALAAAKKHLKQHIKTQLQAGLALLTMLTLISLGLSLTLSNRIGKGLSSFKAFFKIAATKHKQIDIDDLQFSEFVELGQDANQMVKDIAHAKSELDALNRDLEDKVLSRTEELERANRELIKLDKTKSMFISTVSHELRTPLTSILGFTKLIKKDVKKHYTPLEKEPAFARKNQRILQNLIIMEQESERLTRLITDILDLSKIESGHMKWRTDDINIKDCVDQALLAMAGQISRKSTISIDSQVPDELPAVACDKDRLTQVLINLLGNAVKFTEAGVIRVTAEISEEKMLKVSVIDDGPGIKPEDTLVIFDKFRQVKDKIDIYETSGTGLGLAISKQIIEHFGGTIWVESEYGKGSTFIFTLPLK